MSESMFYLEDFNLDSESKKIISCPTGNSCIESKYISSKRYYYARFSAEKCVNCDCIQQCPVKVKNKFSVARIFKKSESQKKYKKTDKNFIIDGDAWKYIGKETHVTIPEEIEGKQVSEIPMGTFAGKHVKKVVLSDTVKIIRRAAFTDCNELTEVVIPDSVTNIEEFAFDNCPSLRRMELSNNIIEIGSHAFDNCYNLKYIKLPEKIDYIGAYAFSETSLEKIVLPKGIKFLANSLFYNCRYLEEVILQDGIETIGNYTFGNCINLRKINLPDSIKQIGCAAFKNCTKLTSIRIPKNLNEMDETSFNNCINLENVETDDINKRITKFNMHNQIIKAEGITNSSLYEKEEYDSIYNMLRYNTNKPIRVIPIDEVKMNCQEKYIEILNEGIVFKREGKYQEAKDKYMQAIKMNSKDPTAYYNLGKILYILGDFEASARSYKVSYELGIDPYNVLVHLGHALLDPELKGGEFGNVISFYEVGINPYLIKKYSNNSDKLLKIFNNQPTGELMDKYEEKCIKAAKQYLGIE